MRGKISEYFKAVFSIVLMISSIFSGAISASDENTSSAYVNTIDQNQATFANTGYEPWYYYIGNVINSANGNVYISEKDNAIKARGFDIGIIRSYNSHKSGTNSPFGFGWTFNYNIYLAENPDGSVILYDGDGSVHTFTKSEGNNYTSPTGIYSKLTKEPDGSFILRFKDGSYYDFESGGRLLLITDNNRNELSFNYTGGKLSNISDDSGLYLSFSYEDNRISAITDSLGREIKYEYDAGNLIKVTDATGNFTSYSYYDNHKIRERIDKIGNKKLFLYYDDHRVESIRIEVPSPQPSESVLKSNTITNFPTYLTLYSIEYGDSIVHVTDSMGYIISIKINDVGNPVEIIEPLGQTTQMVWDNNEMVGFTDANGKTSAYEYDTRGNLINGTDPQGHVTTYGWDNIDSSAGYVSLLTNTTNPRGFSTIFEYDAKGNLIKTTDASGNGSNTTYNEYGYAATITDYRGATTLFSFDNHGYLMNTTDATGNVTKFENDVVGRLIKTIDPNGYSTQFVYDNNDRVIRTIDSLGNETRYNYNAAGTLINVIDANGHETAYGNNILGKVDENTDATGNQTSYNYDKNGNLVKITSANNGNTTIVYDTLGRVISVTDPLGNTESYTYDAVGNLLELTDANGNTTTYTYDALNRLIRSNATKGYTVTYSYDTVGNVIYVKDSEGYISFNSYDELDRLVSVTADYGTFNKTISYSYDENGNRLTMVDPVGGTTKYEYDPLNRLSKITDPLGEMTKYAYDNTGRRTRVALPNGVVTKYTYDPMDRLLSLMNNKSGGEVISSYDYTYDNVGNRLSMVDETGNTTYYEYDELYRLTKVTYPLGEAVEYTYDALGNRLSKINSTSTIPYTYDEDNRLLTAGAASYSYDNDGNLIKKVEGGKTTVYEYDTLNRLTDVNLPDGGQVSYKYAPTGERISRTDGNGTVYYLYDFEDALMELDSSGLPVVRYTHGPGIDEPISMLRSGLKAYYQLDGLGKSVTSLTDVNENVIASYKYDAFGNILEEAGAVVNPYKFTGREYDEATGIYYYRARYYDAEVGRFLSKDPFGEIDGSNLYLYVGNNPINFVDPYGYWSIKGLKKGIRKHGWNLITSVVSATVGVVVAGGLSVTVVGAGIGGVMATKGAFDAATAFGNIINEWQGVTPSHESLFNIPTSYLTKPGTKARKVLKQIEDLAEVTFSALTPGSKSKILRWISKFDKGKTLFKKTYEFIETVKENFGTGSGSETDSIEGAQPPKNPIPTTPGQDHPDDNHDVSILTVSDSNVNSYFDYQSDSDVAILSSGFYENFASLLNEFGEDFSLVSVNTPIEDLNNYPVLVIPSGGLFGLDSLPSFKSKLQEYVINGGTLIVFTQQQGYEFNAVPGGLSGYGWIEDQSCQYRSVGISTYHPILSNADSATLDVVVDGYFTRYPENSTILLSRTKNGMPAMLMYEYGNGTVIATAAYTDWAYGFYQATKDGKQLVKDMIIWAKDPEDIPNYGSGDSIEIPVNITSHVDLDAEKIIFTVIDPNAEAVDTVNVTDSIQPFETKSINLTWIAPSKYGIFHIDYSLFDDEYGEVQRVRDAEKFAINKYAENPNGFVYQGSNISFAVTSDSENYAKGSDAIFTFHVWNHGDVDKSLTWYWGIWAYFGWDKYFNESVYVPAHSEGTFTYVLSGLHTSTRLRAKIYENGDYLGSTERGFWVFSPSVDIEVAMDREEYAKGESVPISLSLRNIRSVNHSSSVTVRVLDPENNKIFENTFDINLPAYGFENKTLSSSLPTTAEYGVYIVTAEAYSNGAKVGSDSAYFEVSKDYVLKLNFDNSYGRYRIRQNMSMDLEIANVGSTLYSSTVNISIPVLNFSDSKYLELNPGQGKVIHYDGLTLPDNLFAGKYLVLVTMGIDNSTTRFSFFIPESNIILSPDRSAYGAGEELLINLTNTGGVDTTADCSIKFYDPYSLFYENTSSENISTGESKVIGFEIPNHAVSGGYYLIARCRDLETDREAVLSKHYTISGLEASLITSTDKEVYFENESIKAFTNITNLDGAIDNATLNLRVYSLRDLISYDISYNYSDLPNRLEINNTFLDAVADSSSGRFTVGTTGGDQNNTNDDFKNLMYGHPDPWSSFTTIRVDGNDYIYGSSDGTFTASPHFEGSSIVSTWEVEDVAVTQTLTIVHSSTGNPDALEIKYFIVNENETSKNIGIRMMIDTQLGSNDGAPFTIPGIGNVTTEREFVDASVPIYWTTMDSLTDPNIIAHGTLRGVGSDPDKFVIARWPGIGDTTWDYQVDPNASVTSDSAIGMWWDPVSLSTGQSREVATFYGIGYVSETGSAILWENNTPLSIAEKEDILMDIALNATKKLQLVATLYSKSSQIIVKNTTFFYITDKNISMTLKTDKTVYKPNEDILIYGEVKNHAGIAGSYNLSIKKGGEEIYSDAFTLDPNQSYTFTKSTRANNSFILEGTVDGITITDFVRIEYPSVNVLVLAPDIVSRNFDLGVLIENIGNMEVDLNIAIEDETWDVTILEGESRLIETNMSITKNTTLNITLSGDVNKTIQKEIILGENARISLTPQSTYLEGMVEIPYTIENIGLLDSEFNATFSIDDQNVSKSFFVPKGQNITDSVSFNLTKGAHLLRYTSPFEEVNETINVLSPPEFVITSIFPTNMNFSIGQNVTLTFVVENSGGTEGEAMMRLSMPDFEDTNRTWIRPGEKENISFSLTIPDDLEEKSYKAIYELDGQRNEFTFFVQGAKISVDASLEKDLYEEGETAVLTFDVTNERDFDLGLYARVQLGEYEEIKHFNLTDSETLQFNVPVTFNGQKLFYGIYMESGRALYLNAMYIQKKEDIITLYTNKQVYNAGNDVTIFVDTTQSGTLNITAPGFNTSIFVTGSTTLEFTLPKELRSGTYYIDYSFDNFSSAYPFDVIGYSARIIEYSIDKEVYDPIDVVNVKMNVEVNQNISGALKMWIYDPQNNPIDTFETDRNFLKGENKIEVSRDLSTNLSGIHVLVYGIYAKSDLILLASGAEYFDVMEVNLPPIANANGPFMGDEGSPITFNGSASYDPEGMPLTYSWDFGNGSNGTGASPTHAYGDNGIYTVTLTVTDDDGVSDTDTTIVTVNNVAPTANAGTNQTVFSGDTISFSGNFTDTGWLDSHTYVWNFGDGNTTNGTLTPAHIYYDKGVYNVTLRVTDDDGGVGEDTITVTVNPIPATIDIDPDTLNLKSHKMMRHGRWVTAYIELPEGYDVADINVSTVLLNDTISAKLRPSSIGDHDNDGIPDLMVKFDRSDVIDMVKALNLDPPADVELTVTGSLTDGTQFEGSDTIRVIEKGMHKHRNKK